MDVEFSGRIAVISGGAGGIGLATAHRLVLAGAAVSLWDTDESALSKARAISGVRRLGDRPYRCH